MNRLDDSELAFPPAGQGGVPMGESDYLGTLGLELREWREGYAEVALELGQHLRNRSGFAHGGVILSMLDVACARAGCWSDDPARPKFATTLSMSASFMRASRDGVIRAIGRRLPGGNNIFTCMGEVRDMEDNLLAVGQAVFRHRTRSAQAALDRMGEPALQGGDGDDDRRG